MNRKIRTVMEGNAFYEIDEECYEKLQREKEDPENKKSDRRSKKSGNAKEKSGA